MTTPTRAVAARLGTATAAKVVGFAVVLAAVFGAAWAAGAQVGPVGSPVQHADSDHGADEGTAHDAGHDTGHDTGGPAHAVEGDLPGLAAAQDGYRLVLADPVLAPGRRPVTFTVLGPAGRPVRTFDVEHEKQLHLIVVRRDHAGFQHLHPVLEQGTGTWTAEAELTPGAWRVFADFTATGGPPLVLGSDLLVPGRLTPVAAPETRTDVVDAYTVSVDGALQPGERSPLTLRVTRQGAPVTDLQPYLGAAGHLVALREGDLAYLHVHPAGAPGDDGSDSGPDVGFEVEVPSVGRYHLYLDFRHDDVVRTAHLVLDAGDEEHHR